MIVSVDCVFACRYCFFFFKQKTAYEMRISDWSSDVCSSDLRVGGRDAVDLDRIEFVEPLALKQRQRRDVVEGIAEIGEKHRPPVVLGQFFERRGDDDVGFGVERDKEIGRAHV